MTLINQLRQFFFYDSIIFPLLNFCLGIHLISTLSFYQFFNLIVILIVEIMVFNIKFGNALVIASARLFLL